MKQARCVIGMVAVLALGLGSHASARDWFVRGGAAGGDGSQAKPFDDPWLALDAAESGDVIHVAAGVYHGRLETGNWTIDAPDLTMLGGYDANFAARDPWTHLTQLRFHKQYLGRNTGTMILGTRNHSNFILDGFVLDPADRNFYRPGASPSLVPSAISERIISLSSPGVQVRNCILLNAGGGGASFSGEGLRFENNLLLNITGPSVLEVRAARATKPAVIHGNTFAFAWEPKPAAVIINTLAQVSDNVFANCMDHAINVSVPPEQVTLRQNHFWMNRAANVRYVLKGGQAGQVGDDNMGDLEDIGFAASDGNEVVEPSLPGLDPAWLEQFTQRYIFLEGATAQKLNVLRSAAKLAPTSTPPPEGMQVGSFAPPYDTAKSAALVPATAVRGARRVKLDVKLAAAAPPPPQHTYEPATWEALAQQPQTLAGKRVAIKGLFGGEQSQFPFAAIKEDTYRGVRLSDPANQGGLLPLVYVRRGSRIERAVTEQPLIDNVVPRPYIVRGIVHHDPSMSGRFKGTLVVESIELYEPDITPDKPRTAGKDLYVRAGAAGGNGSKDKPFKDPWQALEAATAGDTIHVAQGEYFGKLNRGAWDIDKKDLALLGGYDKDFATRDPWKQPTRLGYKMPPAGGGQKPSSFIFGTADHAGLIIDGFVFDGRDINTYKDDLRLDVNASPLTPLIQLWASSGCAVRNCVFVNGSGEAVSISGQGTVIENNIILNTHGRALNSKVQLNRQPNVIRNNTILFAWTSRAGKSTSSGAGVYITGEEVGVLLEKNLIGYCDGPAVYYAGSPQRLRLTGNVFVNNLFAHFADSKTAMLHDRSFGQLADVGFGLAEKNLAAHAPLPVEKAWMEAYITRSSAAETNIAPGQWDEIRKSVGLTPAAGDGGGPATAPAADEKPAAPPSVDDLLARLESIKPAAATADKPATVIAFCPIYDWKKAIELIDLKAPGDAGARRIELKGK